jgi:hypothetical protein
MSKSTTLILAALGLGGLGYFLYKKGLFSNVSLETKLVNTPTPSTPINTKKACPEGQELVDVTCIKAPCPSICMPIKIVVKDPIIGTPIQVKVEDPIYNDSYYEAKSTNPIVIDKFGDEKPITFDEQFGNGGFFGNNTINYNNDYKLGINENYHYR